MSTLIYLIHTDQHGYEPVAFYTEDEAVRHADDLSEFAAYRTSSFTIISMDGSLQGVVVTRIGG